MIDIWLTMILAGIITFVIRVSFILLFGKIRIPIRVQQALNLVPPAVFSAIIFPDMLLQNNQLAIHLNNGRMIAGMLAILVAWRTRNIILTVLIGMIVLTLYQTFIH